MEKKENIQYMITLFNGEEIRVNVKEKNIFHAANEIQQSIVAGDIRLNGIPIKENDVRTIEDIQG